MVTYETIEYEVGADKVGTVTLNRPHRLNAWDPVMCDEFQHLWRTLREDDQVNAIVLRAAGDRAFSTGADQKSRMPHPANPFVFDSPGKRLCPKQNHCWKPVVCAVHGMAAGGAFYWINEADIVIASDDAEFFDPHVTNGLVAALEPTGLAYRIPLGEVLRIFLLGLDERLSAQRAKEIGLVSEVVAREVLWDRAHELAARIARKPSVATQGTVRAIWESLDRGRQAALDNAMLYTQVGNPVGTAEVTSAFATGERPTYEVRH